MRTKFHIKVLSTRNSVSHRTYKFLRLIQGYYRRIQRRNVTSDSTNLMPSLPDKLAPPQRAPLGVFKKLHPFPYPLTPPNVGDCDHLYIRRSFPPFLLAFERQIRVRNSSLQPEPTVRAGYANFLRQIQQNKPKTPQSWSSESPNVLILLAQLGACYKQLLVGLPSF